MKAKIISVHLITILIVGVCSYVYIKFSLKADMFNDAQRNLKLSRKLFSDRMILRGYRLMAEVQRKASAKEVRAVFDPLPPDEKKAEETLRKRAWLVSDKYAHEELKYDPLFYRKPEIVAITNPKGIVIARDTDINANVGELWGKRYNLVKFALNGRSKWDIIEFEGKYLQAAASPIVRDEGIVGCLLAGFEIDNGMMDAEGKILTSEVGIFIKNKIYSSSFDDEATREGITKLLWTAEKAKVKQSIDKNKPSEVFELKVQDEPFIATISPLGGNFQVGKVGYIVLKSLKKTFAPISCLWGLVGFTLFGVILAIVLGLFLATHFIKPIETLESEVRKVIEGDFEHRWEIKSGELGGLSYLINQMLDVLTGEEEEEEAEKEEAPRVRVKTEEEFMKEGESTFKSIEEMMSESEDQYYRRIYSEFREAKKRLGEDPDSVTFEQFVAKLKETESNILSKQKGSGVRFQLQIQGNKISYKPIILP